MQSTGPTARLPRVSLPPRRIAGTEDGPCSIPPPTSPQSKRGEEKQPANSAGGRKRERKVLPPLSRQPLRETGAVCPRTIYDLLRGSRPSADRRPVSARRGKPHPPGDQRRLDVPLDRSTHSRDRLGIQTDRQTDRPTPDQLSRDTSAEGRCAALWVWSAREAHPRCSASFGDDR